ncbi:PREDICTED: RNA-directed DNA polymerase homolog [Priapulus caudatus]|uniref:RNA-directed DNA polymerase homolog n=1 Tax=Priapulus caudatus TaxID=37621 RepID=A0ABM1F3Q8_PRICU|nr:PREDICTED: RNA-directed DNA polymerase homolog [Priapulus caudatus]
MEQMGVITKVTEPTDWVSSLAFSRKSNGRLRVCLDPKDLNTAIKRPHYKTPTLEEITHRFAGATTFSKLDARHGYWSISLDAQSSWLTTFNSPFGRYRFRRLPFGLNVSQDVFQKRMDHILEQCPGTTGIADDVAVFGKSKEV